MSGVSIAVDDAALRHALTALQARVRDLRQPLREIGQSLVTLTDLAFRGQHDPWGNAWKELSEVTLARRRKGHGTGAAQILRDTGRLQNSINARASKDSVRVGTNVVYAAIHQFGGDIHHAASTRTLYFRQNRDGTVGHRFVRKRRSNFTQTVDVGAHTIHIPARPFLPIRGGRIDLPSDALDDMLDILRHHLTAAS